MELEVRRIEPGQSAVLRSTRLAALADSPSAFGSNLARELAFDEQVWSERAAASSRGDRIATFLAWQGADVVGIVTGSRQPAGDVELTSMWTSPDARRIGLGNRLIEAVAQWGVDNGAATISLWVTRGNDAAQRLYESVGFTETGDFQPLPSDPCKDEIRMTRQLP